MPCHKCDECDECYGEYIPTPEEFEENIKKDIPKDALCHSCTYVCIFHEGHHYKCPEYIKKPDVA